MKYIKLLRQNYRSYCPGCGQWREKTDHYWAKMWREKIDHRWAKIQCLCSWAHSTSRLLTHRYAGLDEIAAELRTWPAWPTTSDMGPKLCAAPAKKPRPKRDDSRTPYKLYKHRLHMLSIGARDLGLAALAALKTRPRP